MQNTKVLEMLNNGRIEELKALLQDEIYQDGLKSCPGAKQRYAAMKRYINYFKMENHEFTQKPCIVEFKGEKYTSFCNGFSIALTKESSGEIELFSEPESYLKIENIIRFDGTAREVNFTRIIAKARSKGYKLKKSETRNDCKFLFHYDGAYYAIRLLDASYSIINDGEKATVWHKDGGKLSPIVIENDIGICFVLPINPKAVRDNDIMIEA